jgi:ribosomal protein L37AE/L43A
MKKQKTPTVKISCPKCSSPAVEKNKNQEFRCNTCGKIFYFVTPKYGSDPNSKKYKL